MRLKSFIILVSLTTTLMAFGPNSTTGQSKNTQGMNNMSVRFLTFDINGNGFLEKPEFYALRNAYPSKCAQNGGVVRDKLLLFIDIDLNGDEKISPFELNVHRSNR